MIRLAHKLMSAVALAALTISLSTPVAAAATDKESTKSVASSFGKTRLAFEANRGQTDANAKFIGRASGYSFFLTPDAVSFKLKNDAVTLRFVGAERAGELTGDNELVAKTNYYKGRDAFTNIPNFAAVERKNLYPGIDVRFYDGGGKSLEYDLIVAPNADAGVAKIAIDDDKTASLDEAGSLVVKTADGDFVQHKPVAYQLVDGERRAVEAEFVIENNVVSFKLGDYDRALPLTIDPVVNFLSYLGGSDSDSLNKVKTDAAGNIYLAGETSSLDFPETRPSRFNSAALIVKLNPDGTEILYATILDGESSDIARSIAVDSSGNAYVTGDTESDRFPTSAGAYQGRRSFCNVVSFPIDCLGYNQDVFVTKLNASGQIGYSTYIGGQKSDRGFGIVVDGAGKAYVTGETTSGLTYPKKNEFQGTGFFGTGDDAFLTVLNSTGTALTYSTGLGGNRDDKANAIAIDAANNVYIAGETKSDNSFPLKSAMQAVNNGGEDGFVAKFNPSLSGDASLVYSTFLGGGGTDHALGIAVDAINQAYVTGLTGSLNFPLRNAFRSTNQVNEAFVTVLTSSGALANSTFLGGASNDIGRDIDVTPTGTIYVTGETGSADFPTLLAFQSTKSSADDTFVTKLRFPTGIMFSSFLGGNGVEEGLALDVRGSFIYLAGSSQSSNLATTAGVVKPTSDSKDGYVAKILDVNRDTIGVFDVPTTNFLLRNSLTAGAADITVNRGIGTDTPLTGDFDGDGIDTASTFNSGVWKIRNTNNSTADTLFPPITINFGGAGDIPVVGDWNGDGIDTPGLYRPSAGQFFLTNSLGATPPIDVTINFGIAEDLPVAGDWNSDGVDSVGVFRPSAGQFFLTNDNELGATIDVTAFFGTAGDLPVAGDWNGDGADSVGVWRPSNLTFFLSNDNIAIANQFVFGTNANAKPVAGDWDGRP